MKTITTLNNQAVMDIAIQEYGSPEGVWLLLVMNQDKLNTITDEPTPGTELNIVELSDISTSGATGSNAAALSVPQQIYIPVGNTGIGGSDEYVRLIGDDIIEGIKTFLTKIKVNTIQPVTTGQAININNVPINDGVIDAGTF